MKALYDLKELLCKQLEDYGKRGEISAAVLERVDMLAHAVKNLDKVIEAYEAEEDGYSGADYQDGDVSRRNYDGDNRAYRGDRSMARRRDSMGRYSRGYSRHNGMAERLRDLMEDAPDDRTRQEIQRLVSKMEQM